MLELGSGQLTVVALVAAVSVGRMVAAIVHLFSQRAVCRATTRQATTAESALVGGGVPEGTRMFDGWSYRVGARFAGRVRVAVSEAHVTVAGPRVPRRLYESWIWTQGLALALVPPAVVAAAIVLDWRRLLVAFGFFLFSYVVSTAGAGLWPGLGELSAVDTGHFTALEFPRSAVHEIDIGKGWSKGGLEIVLFPYRAAIDKMAGKRALSFFAPDEYGRDVRFAIHMTSDADVTELSELLGSNRPESHQEGGSE